MAHHEWGRSVGEIGEADFGVLEHEAIMRMIHHLAEYDQMDMTNLAGVEVMLRRAQMIEHFHRERQRLEAVGGKEKLPIDREEADIFMGTVGGETSLMVCPTLVSHIAKELERQSAIDKQARKAREERALRRK